MKYFFETYGCEMNIAESAAVEQLLISRSWQKASSVQVADLVVINSCSIRKTAEDRIIGRLGYFSGLKKVREKKQNAKNKMYEEAALYSKDEIKPLTLVFMGCMAERLLKSIKNDWPCIDYVVGTFSKHLFPKIIDAIENKENSFILDNSCEYKFASLSYEQDSFSCFVPIMHGCNNFCTYCIVPYVRGRECSRDLSEILNELDILSKYGVRDITLLGQNVNSYKGKDENGNEINFASLLKIISDHLEKNSSSIEWVRFMSSHPKDFTDDVIKVIATQKRLCHHIHLPVQNGSNSVLRAMNRRYTREDYLTLVEKIKKEIPDVSLTTDIMMGFPCETENDVEETLDLMKIVKYESAMMYYYNEREGTPAAKMKQLDIEIKKERLQRIIDLQLKHTREQMERRVGNTVKVLAECVSRDNSDELLGKTEQNEKVAFAASKKIIGSFVDVKITELSGNTFRGIIV